MFILNAVFMKKKCILFEIKMHKGIINLNLNTMTHRIGNTILSGSHLLRNMFCL